MSKLQCAFVLICLANVCLSARIVREAVAAESPVVTNEVEKDSSSSEEFTMEDVNKMKKELISADMPEKDVRILGHIFEKLTPNSTVDEKMDGFMKVMLITFAISQNKTDDQVLHLIESFDSGEVKEVETPKNELLKSN